MQKKTGLFHKIALFFGDNSPFMTRVGRIAALAVLNLCWLLCTLPVITGGAALTALYTVLSELNTLSYTGAFRRFFQVFPRRLRNTLLPWVATVVILAGLAAAWHTVLSANLTDNFAAMTPLLLVSCLLLFTVLWLFPLLALRRERGLAALAAAFLMGLRELWRSAVMAVLAVVALVLPLWCAETSLVMVGLWFLFGFSPIAWLMLRITAL